MIAPRVIAVLTAVAPPPETPVAAVTPFAVEPRAHGNARGRRTARHACRSPSYLSVQSSPELLQRSTDSGSDGRDRDPFHLRHPSRAQTVKIVKNDRGTVRLPELQHHAGNLTLKLDTLREFLWCTPGHIPSSDGVFTLRSTLIFSVTAPHEVPENGAEPPS